MKGELNLPPSDDVILVALAEDLGVSVADLSRPAPGLLDRDVTGSLLPAGASFSGVVRARRAGVICGLPVAVRAFQLLARASASEPPECFPLVAEGARVAAGEGVLEIDGPARVVLAGERTALNLLMTLSGIATAAARWQAAAGAGMAIVDTRKTLPGLRALSKYAVRVGGATNHRMGLYDMVLVKDNHIAASGGVGKAVERARRLHPELLVEVEADTVELAAEAAASAADLVLLDNMDDDTLRRAVRAVAQAAPVGHRCLTEASGGVTYERLATLAGLGLDRVSASAITLTAPLDLGLDARGEGR